MQLIVKRIVAAGIGFDTLAPFGVPRNKWDSYLDEVTIDMSKMDDSELEALRDTLQAKKNHRGVGVLLTDVNNWIEILKEGATTQRARTVRQFHTIITQYLLNVPGHRLYRRHTDGAWLCYYVNRTKYEPPNTSRDNYHPAYVQLTLLYYEFGEMHSSTVTFEPNDCIGKSCAKVLGDAGYATETPELRQMYLDDIALWHPTSGAIGKQYWAGGKAYPVNTRHSWDRENVVLDREGEPARVVVDVFKESGEESRSSNRDYVDNFFWANIGRWSHYNAEEDELITPKNKRSRKDRWSKQGRGEGRRRGEFEPDEEEELEESDLIPLDENDTLLEEKPEVPTHPWLVVFHLTKHQRFRCHVRQLVEYTYDTSLAEKLILPQDQKNLVKLLIQTRGGAFEDIVRGKSGGAIILLSGPPGTGKTLTAEVYAESEQRPLYTVQCSQLGTNPDKLEEALQNVFNRAKRWNAVMLLDEADVYVHERGNNIQQNAIVGVFLRVLEYQAGVLFLTTNRPDDVDDAIASRCIARLALRPPSASDAAKIWQVLAWQAKAKIELDTIREIVLHNPGMTGRDIKNILKLAILMEGAENGITETMVDFVKQFKPTGALFDRSEE